MCGMPVRSQNTCGPGWPYRRSAQRQFIPTRHRARFEARPFDRYESVAMPNDVVPTFRFNRPRTPSFSAPSPRPHQASNPWAEPRASKPEAKSPPASRLPAQTTGRDAVALDADLFLQNALGGTSQPVGSSGWLQRAGLNIRKASDAQHLEAIALAYATYVRISASPMKSAVMAELETLSGRKRSRTTHDLHLIVERFVSYGGETAAERLAARKLISRDVRAIQHLEAANMLPSRVQALAATPGQGLHAWARQSAAAKRRVTAPPNAADVKQQAKAEARQRALVHEVTITTRRADGTRKARRRFKITGVLSTELDPIRARLERLERRSGVGSCVNARQA